jgi:6-pyruvoyltetrahydropterin/6-carboxytetrahydropterin synthase
MFSLGVWREFTCQHALTGGDWGAENLPHAHHYRVELRLEGDQLDQHGFLADITAVEAALAAALERYQDRLLNDLPEFAGRNPSTERLAQVLAETLQDRLTRPGLRALTVTVWESPSAWAAARLEQ